MDPYPSQQTPKRTNIDIMKTLLVFAVAAVLSGLSEGNNITKCELRDQLNSTALPLLQAGKTSQPSMDLVAKLVCHVEKTTGFNTSTVTTVSIDIEVHTPKRGRRGAEDEGDEGQDRSDEGHKRPDEGHVGEFGGHNGTFGGHNGTFGGHNGTADGPAGGKPRESPKRGRRGAEHKEGSKGGVSRPPHGTHGSDEGHDHPDDSHDDTFGGHNSTFGGLNGTAGGHNGTAGGKPLKRDRRGAEHKGGSKGGVSRPPHGMHGSDEGHDHPDDGHDDTFGGHNSTFGGLNGTARGHNGTAGGKPLKRGRRGAEHKGGSKKGPPARGKESSSESNSDEDSEEENQVWHLYGLFQLSDHVACSDGVTPSTNICDMSCSDLLDNDITDDIACLETIKAKLQTASTKDNRKLMRMVNLLSTGGCENETASGYFADC